jgi:catechol 2,3-dioxygenase-like lactoylglutathione lyase family enzyme
MHNDLHHVLIFVSDMGRSLHLFKDILGFEMV